MRLLCKIVLGQMKEKKLQAVHMLLSLILSVAMVTVIYAAFDAIKAPYEAYLDLPGYRVIVFDLVTF